MTVSLEKYKIPNLKKNKSSCLVGEGSLSHGVGTACGRELLELQGCTVSSVHGGLRAQTSWPGVGAAAKPSVLAGFTSSHQPSPSHVERVLQGSFGQFTAFSSSSLRDVPVPKFLLRQTDGDAFPDSRGALAGGEEH